MQRRGVHFINRKKEEDLINILLSIVDNRHFNHENTAVLMVSPDYSATVAMHLAHAWSDRGEMIDIIPVNVTYPDETYEKFADKFIEEFSKVYHKYEYLVLVEAGIIRGGNWNWLINVLINNFQYTREQITLVALCENIHSKVKSDYVAEYYDDNVAELTFYYERFNNHWV